MDGLRTTKFDTASVFVGETVGLRIVIQKLAHEFRHAEQFLDGQIAFARNPQSGAWHGYRDDNVDEAEAWIAGFDAEPPLPSQRSTSKGKFVDSIPNAYPFGVSAVAKALNESIGTAYSGRGTTQLDIKESYWQGGKNHRMFTQYHGNRPALLALIVLLVASMCAAQKVSRSEGLILGSIGFVNKEKGFVPSPNVTVILKSRLREKSIVSDENGDFLFSNLPVGKYCVTLIKDESGRVFQMASNQAKCLEIKKKRTTRFDIILVQ